MKKIVSILLSCVMVLALCAPAFALTLVPVEEPTEELIEIAPFAPDGDQIMMVGKGGTYYVMLDPAINYTHVEVAGVGCVKAEYVVYDPTIYAPLPGVTYKVMHRYDKVEVETGMTYEDAKAKAKELNKENKTTAYIFMPEAYANVIKMTIADNYNAAYAEGALTVRAYDEDAKVYATGSIKVINDVVIFNYENVKYCAENKVALVSDEDYGYSDYDTAMHGYANAYKYELNPTVVTTAAFRAIEGKDLMVDAEDMVVTIYNVAKNQHSVNFSAHGLKLIDKDKDGKCDKMTFGFYGKAPIASNFDIAVNTGYTYYTLREAFKIKLEENDVVTYYVTKDGKEFSQFTVDYSKDELDTPVNLIIDGHAGEILGEYELSVMTVTAPEVTPEENPNTGAPSFWEWLLHWFY